MTWVCFLNPVFLLARAYQHSGTHYPNATGHNDGQDEPMPLEGASVWTSNERVAAVSPDLHRVWQHAHHDTKLCAEDWRYVVA